MIGNRKFFIAIFSLLMCLVGPFLPNIKEIAVAYYTCLGSISGGFFAINGVEHWAASKKGE